MMKRIILILFLLFPLSAYSSERGTLYWNAQFSTWFDKYTTWRAIKANPNNYEMGFGVKNVCGRRPNAACLIAFAATESALIEWSQSWGDYRAPVQWGLTIGQYGAGLINISMAFKP